MFKSELKNSEDEVKNEVIFLLRLLSLPMNPPLDSHPTSRWSTEAAVWIYFLFVIRKGGGA